LKLQTNTKISIIVIICAIISYFFLVNIVSYNFAILSPLVFENIKTKNIIKNDVITIKNTAVSVYHKLEYGAISNF